MPIINCQSSPLRSGSCARLSASLLIGAQNGLIESAQDLVNQRVDTRLICRPNVSQRINKTRVQQVTHSFRLHSLGTPALFTVAGEQVPFRTRKHLALLIRLALESGKQFTRDYLADLLWPDAPPKHANHSLAQGLSVIKAKIARDAVIIKRATVGLAAGWIDVDVLHLSNGEVAITGPFLDSLEIAGARSLEDWKDEYRARLIPQVRDCLVRQMDAARRIG